MNMTTTLRHSMMLLVGILFLSCNDFLNQKLEKSMVVPETLDDLQALLDMSNFTLNQGIELAELISDNVYVSDSDWLGARDNDRLNYVWAAEAQSVNWLRIYQHPVYIANVVLDAAKDIKVLSDQERARRDQIVGMALYLRAFHFYQLAQLYCLPFAQSTAQAPGIVLRTTAAIEVRSTRASVGETYERILLDLNAAESLLPENTALPTRPCKTAASGLLARVYLSMGMYAEAGKHADDCLKNWPHLMDFNDIPASNLPFDKFNQEVIYYDNGGSNYPLMNASRAKVDSALVKSYTPTDLRRLLFFQGNSGANTGTYRFVGNYDSENGPSRVFTGITTGEMYLIRSECRIRASDVEAGIGDLNHLLRHRHEKADWQPIDPTSLNAADALELLLSERRKELVFRSLRWGDLRRLNMEGKTFTLSRKIGSEVYTLGPEDPRWVLLIPDEVVSRSGIAQNIR